VASQPVTRISAHHATLEAPAELRELPGWMLWRYEENRVKPGAKPRKMPYYADGGKRTNVHGSPADRGRLVTFAAARAAAQRRGMDGVGLALMPEFGITALDFDNCLDADGEVPPELVNIVGTTYTEFSPSGKGLRAFVKGSYGSRKSKVREPYGFETFFDSGFTTFTGNVHPLCAMMDCEDVVSGERLTLEAVEHLCETRFGSVRPFDANEDDFTAGLEKPLGLSIERMEELLGVLDPDLGREEWIKVGMALHHECDGDDTGFYLWDAWSAGGAKYVSEEDLRNQWDSFERRKGSRQRQVTMRSVLQMAKEAGLPPRTTDPAVPEVLKAVAEAAAPEGPVRGFCTPADFEGLYPVWSAAAVAVRPAGTWWVKNLLPQAELGMLFGASGAGKTFVALDLAVHVALGRDWRGNKVRKGRVLIVAAEGGGGIAKRVDAYCRFHAIDPATLDVGVVLAAPNILNSDCVAELVKAIAAAGGADLIIWDTYAQVTPGANENGAEDMGLALANLRAIHAATKAMNLLVHHAGKDASKGARGWSGLRAAVDVELEVIRTDRGERELRTSKMKDGEDHLSWGFRLEVVTLGVDEDGDNITSCVVVEAAVPVSEAVDKPKGRTRRYAVNERHVLEIIDSVYEGVESVGYYELVATCVEALPPEKKPVLDPETGQQKLDPKGQPVYTRDTRRQRVERALATLRKGEEAPIKIEHGRVIFFTTPA